jgi:hypothetical protein
MVSTKKLLVIANERSRRFGAPEEVFASEAISSRIPEQIASPKRLPLRAFEVHRNDSTGSFFPKEER